MEYKKYTAPKAMFLCEMNQRRSVWVRLYEVYRDGFRIDGHLTMSRAKRAVKEMRQRS